MKQLVDFKRLNQPSPNFSNAFFAEISFLFFSVQLKIVTRLEKLVA